MHYQTPTRLQAAILDWAGTVVDFGSFAPTRIFVEAFASFDIELSLEEARGPMGMGKWDHIRALCDQPAVAERFVRRFGRTPSDDDVTAIFVANDQMALGLLRALHEKGRAVPGDLSVVGFDDTAESAHYWPPLTTVRQSFAEVGRRSVDALISQIQAGEHHHQPVAVPTELIVRSSTAPPRRS